MKRFFVQCEEVLLESDADPSAPGGAVPLRLCGNWDHAGPCRWLHRTLADWDGRRGKIRVIFTAPAEEATAVRSLIDRALADGECAGPDGRPSRWTATAHDAGALNEEEAALSAPWESAGYSG